MNPNMRTKLWIILTFFSAWPVLAQKKIELEALELKVKIQEPTLLFIINQPELEINPYFEDQISFLDKIEKPVIENRLTQDSNSKSD